MHGTPLESSRFRSCCRVRARGGVERRERLIEEQEGGLGRQRPCQCHALPLAARNGARIAPGEVVQSERLEVLALARAGGIENVGGNREVREQGVVLRHIPGATLLRRETQAARGIEPRLPSKSDGAVERAIEAREHPQQRRLARAGWAEQYGDGRAIERQLQIGVHLEAGSQPRAANAAQLIGHTFQTRRWKE